MWFIEIDGQQWQCADAPHDWHAVADRLKPGWQRFHYFKLCGGAVRCSNK